MIFPWPILIFEEAWEMHGVAQGEGSTLHRETLHLPVHFMGGPGASH
jgi:hypothetical protein